MQDGKLHKEIGCKIAEIVHNHEFCWLTFDNQQAKKLRREDFSSLLNPKERTRQWSAVWNRVDWLDPLRALETNVDGHNLCANQPRNGGIEIVLGHNGLSH